MCVCVWRASRCPAACHERGQTAVLCWAQSRVWGFTCWQRQMTAERKQPAGRTPPYLTADHPFRTPPLASLSQLLTTCVIVLPKHIKNMKLRNESYYFINITLSKWLYKGKRPMVYIYIFLLFLLPSGRSLFLLFFHFLFIAMHSWFIVLSHVSSFILAGAHCFTSF